MLCLRQGQVYSCLNRLLEFSHFLIYLTHHHTCVKRTLFMLRNFLPCLTSQYRQSALRISYGVLRYFFSEFVSTRPRWPGSSCVIKTRETPSTPRSTKMRSSKVMRVACPITPRTVSVTPIQTVTRRSRQQRIFFQFFSRKPDATMPWFFLVFVDPAGSQL